MRMLASTHPFVFGAQKATRESRFKSGWPKTEIRV
jgi:hypothetical protein